MNDEAFEALASLNPLIAQAEREGKWLYCNYQGMWFSPKELRRANADGRFIWGAVNWCLRNPQEYLNEAIAAAEAANKKVEIVKARIGK